MRRFIAELLATELPLVARVAAIDRAASALVRLLRANQQLSREATDAESDFERALRDMGMGEQ